MMERTRKEWAEAGWIGRLNLLLLVVSAFALFIALSTYIAGILPVSWESIALGVFMILTGAFWLTWPPQGRRGQEEAFTRLRPWMAAGFELFGLATLLLALPETGAWPGIELGAIALSGAAVLAMLVGLIRFGLRVH